MTPPIFIRKQPKHHETILMKHKNLLSFLALIVFLFAPGLLQAAKPNFIIIFADDQGYGDLSC